MWMNGVFVVAGKVLNKPVDCIVTGFVLVDLFSTGLVDVVGVEKFVDRVGRVEGWVISSLVNREVFAVFRLWGELISIEGIVAVGLLARLVTTIVGDVVTFNCASVVDFVPTVELFN